MLAADKKGISDDNLGWFDFPDVAGGKGEPTDTLGGINGWLVTKGAPQGNRRFPEASSSRRMCRSSLRPAASLSPSFKGADDGLDNVRS